jgi:hypothetical protein
LALNDKFKSRERFADAAAEHVGIMPNRLDDGRGHLFTIELLKQLFELNIVATVLTISVPSRNPIPTTYWKSIRSSNTGSMMRLVRDGLA